MDSSLLAYTCNELRYCRNALRTSARATGLPLQGAKSGCNTKASTQLKAADDLCSLRFRPSTLGTP